MYSCFEKTFIEDFYKILIKINIFSTYFRSINVSNVDIILKHSANVSTHIISIDINILITYLNNFIIIHSNHE